MKQTYCIYRLLNLVTEKSYIGYTKNFKHRMYSHRHSAVSGSELYIHKSIRKYGWDNFEASEIFYGWDKKFILEEMEPYFIQYFNSQKNGYNLTRGGEGLSEPSEECIQKLKDAGHNISEETRRKRSEASKKAWANPTKRQNIQNSLIENGQKVQTKLGNSQRAKERWASTEFKEKMDKVYQDPEVRKRKSIAATGRKSILTTKVLSIWQQYPSLQHKEIAKLAEAKTGTVKMILKRHGHSLGYEARR